MVSSFDEAAVAADPLAASLPFDMTTSLSLLSVSLLLGSEEMDLTRCTTDANFIFHPHIAYHVKSQHIYIRNRRLGFKSR
jgi:hypothetical protein